MSSAVAQSYPQPTVPLTAEQPLFLFRMSPAASWMESDGVQISERFGRLPNMIRPMSGVILNPGSAISADFENVLDVLEEAEVPVFVEVAEGGSPERIARLLEKNPGVAGVLASGLRFDEYDRTPGTTAYSTPPNVRWALDAIDATARFGRRFLLELDGVNAARLMANQECRILLDKIRGAATHVTPIARLSDAHAIPGIMSAMGLWLEESVETWGVAATAEWYENAPYLEPGVFGARDDVPMPAPFYRIMIANGVMTGATVYVIESESALWYADDPFAWREAVLPTLEDTVHMGLIPRREFVQRKTQVALQLVSADSSPQFHLNLGDLDAELDAGLLLYGAYGLEQPGLVHELVPNSGRHYWVPVLSPTVPEEVTKRFARVVTAGTMMTAEEWTDLLDRIYQPDGAGTAFISRIGRGVFVMHTRENRYEQQTFRLPRLPTPVYGATGERSDGGVVVSWPFREDDFAYRVYRRIPGETPFELAAEVSDQRSWFDSSAGADTAVSYAVTAFTDEGAPFEGTVNYGDCLVFSTVESRIAESIDFEPGTDAATIRRVDRDTKDRPLAQEWWPGGEPVPTEHRLTANEIVGRLVDWSQSFSAEELGDVMDLYATDYVDPQGWGYQYARRAYQWFFERYDQCRLHTQVRTWDFTEAAEGEVAVRVFVQGTGVALTDAGGTHADVQVRFPRTGDQEALLVFRNNEGAWRLVRTEPALPNMRELLSFSLGPDNGYSPGPDVYPQ